MIRLYAYAGIAVAAVAGYFWWAHRVETEALEGERARVEHQAEVQRTANRSRSHEAESRQAAQTIYRDRFITKTLTEIRYVTQNLAACTVSPDAARLLNAAAECARQDRPGSCPADDAVP
jgi:hypothetical protein